MADIPLAERYLNLATLLMGEALTELGNLRQRGVQPGPDTLVVQMKLQQVKAALNGEPYVVTIDPKHVAKSK